jgi:hypothetical protein
MTIPSCSLPAPYMVRDARQADALLFTADVSQIQAFHQIAM